MNSFPTTVRVEVPAGQPLTCQTEPKITINPVGPSRPGYGQSVTFQVMDSNESESVLKQVIAGIHLLQMKGRPGYLYLPHLIFDLRSIRDVMHVLGIKIDTFPPSDDYLFIGRKQVMDEDMAMVPLLCDLIADVFGPEVGRKQLEMLIPPVPAPKLLAIPIPDLPEANCGSFNIIANGPIIVRGGCHKRVVLTKSGSCYAVSDHCTSESQASFVANSEISTDFLMAVSRFSQRVQDHVLKDFLENNKKQD